MGPEELEQGLGFHIWLTQLKTRYLSELVLTEGLSSGDARVRALIEEPVQSQEQIARLMATNGGVLEELYWYFGVPPSARTGLYVLYRLERGSRIADVVRGIEETGFLRVSWTHLLRTASDMKWSAWARTAGEEGKVGE